VSHLTQGASRGSRVNRAARSRVRDSCLYEPAAQIRVPLTGQSARPGEDSTGAGAERLLGFDPQSKASTKEQGKY
jgi:hypothetical protein